MCFESQRLEKQIKSLESKLKEFPEGKLICAQNENRSKWYVSDGHNSVYLPKNQRQLAEKLATKNYLSLLCEDMHHEKEAIEYYLRHHKPSKAEDLLINESEFQKLLSSTFKSQSQEMNDWINSPYETCKKYSEQRIYKTSSGNIVRSKSEVLIDMALYTNSIPFRYECELNLGNMVIYPDFTIKHPKTGKIYYWEHFGRMDDEVYAKNAAAKIKSYIENRIVPTIDLITTYETKENPLDYEMVKKIVEDYFQTVENLLVLLYNSLKLL